MSKVKQQKDCTHRYEVTFSITVIGIGDTRDEVIEDAKEYSLCDYDFGDLEVVKVTQDTDSCNDCIEEKE